MRELGEVRVHQDGETTVLAPGMNTRLFREGELFYEVECPAGTQVLFDDQPLSLVGRAGGHTAGYGRMDLTNQVGFHRFTLGVEPRARVSAALAPMVPGRRDHAGDDGREHDADEDALDEAHGRGRVMSLTR